MAIISISSILSWGIFGLLLSYNIQIAHGQDVECPNLFDNDAWTRVELNGGGLIFRYAIVLSASASSEDSIMCGYLQSDTVGWVGFGISPEGMCLCMGGDVISCD